MLKKNVRLCSLARVINIPLQVPVLSFHHPMTAQHLRTLHQCLHSTAQEMENLFCGQWMDTVLAHHMYSIKEYNTPFIISLDGLIVSSQLIVPTTKVNNNVTIICTVWDSLFNHQSSNPVKLYLQGLLYACILSIFIQTVCSVRHF